MTGTRKPQRAWVMYGRPELQQDSDPIGSICNKALTTADAPQSHKLQCEKRDRRAQRSFKEC